MGHLHALWHVALEQQEDGDLSSWSDESIAEYSDFPGDAPQYVRLLQKYRWLDGKIIHDWLDYAGRFLMKKYSTSGRERLVDIWFKYGRIYGSGVVANSKRPNSDPKESLPYPTLPNQPNQEREDSSGKPDAPAKPPKPKSIPKPRKEPEGDHAELILYHGECWKATHGADYAFCDGRDGKAVKTILDACKRDLGHAKRCVDALFADPDKFVSASGHPLYFLANNINRFLGIRNGKPNRNAGERFPEPPAGDLPFFRDRIVKNPGPRDENGAGGNGQVGDKADDLHSTVPPDFDR